MAKFVLNKLYIYIYYLSISPKTKSCVPIIVTKSAKYEYFDIKSIPCKCRNPGDFILHL